MGKLRVLIVEDHRLMREGMKALLNAEPDIEVVGDAERPREGVEMARQLQPDVVLMDLKLRDDGDGIAATRDIKQWCPNTSVLVLTGQEREDYLFAALKAGAVGYLLKDQQSGDIIRAVRTAVEGGSPFHPVMARRLAETIAHARTDADATPRLTERELQVLHLMAKGASNREIAGHLFLAEKTVKQHASKIFKKLNVRSRSQAVLYAVQNGLTG